MHVRPMYPGEDYAGGVIIELLPDLPPERRCRVRLNDGRVIVGCIPVFCNRYTDWYQPEPGDAVTVYMKEHNGEFLLVGFPRLERGKATLLQKEEEERRPD